MSINRAPFNALVDDDGSNLIGSVWNKAAIKDVILDPVDAELLKAGGNVVTATPTGTVNDYALTGRTTNTAWLWAGAANLTLTGLAAGVAGDRLTIKNLTAPGSGLLITLPHQASGSAAADRWTNFVTSAATVIAPMGAAQYVHNGTAWILVNHEQGDWIASAYNAANFLNWLPPSGAVITYILRGRTLMVSWSVSGATISAGGNTAIYILSGAYGGYAAVTTAQFMTVQVWVDGGASNVVGFAQTGLIGADRIGIYKSAVAQWVVGSANVNSAGLLIFQVT